MFTNEITASATIADFTLLLLSVSVVDPCLQLQHDILKKIVAKVRNMTTAKTGVK
jgi:hypothetical protein